MSQIRKLAGGGSTTWGKFTKDGVVYNLNDETVRNNVLNRLQASAGEYGDFYEQLLAPLRNGEDRSGDSISNRTDLVSGFSNVSDRTNRNLNSTDRTTRQKRRDARRQNDTWVSQNAIKNFLAAFTTPSAEETSKSQEEIDNSIRAFEYNSDGKFDPNSIANKAIKNRLRYYYDYISDNDAWNKAYKWSNPIDKQRESDLRLWFDSLGTDYLGRRNAMEEAVNKAIADAEAASSWAEVPEESKRILSYFNIGVEKGSTPESDEDAQIKASKKKWTDAGYNDSLYDLIGDSFELDDEGNLRLISGKTFNLGDWHNGRNIYFNDDFYKSDLAKTGAFDALKGYTYYDGQLYKQNDPRLARILNSENGYNALMKTGNFTGADAEIMTRFTNAAKENPGILSADKYSSFLASNPNYRFQNLTGLVERTDKPLEPGQQIIQYIDLTTPDVDENDPYTKYTYKYRLLDADGNDLDELDPSVIQDITNGQVQDFSAYNRIVGTDSPYDGMYYKDYETIDGKEVPVRIYHDPKDENNIILHLPTLNAAGVKGGDIRLPANVAKIILSNKNLITNLAGNSKNMANFQMIVSRLVQSAGRAKNGFLSYVTPIDWFTSEKRQLEKMGFSQKEAEDLWNAIKDYAKSASRSQRVAESITYTPIRKLGGKINYIEKLANGGRSGGTTNATSKRSKVNTKLQVTGNAAGLSDFGTSAWHPEDTADLVALGADLAAAGIMLADPTNIGGALAGAAGSLARFQADTLRHRDNPAAGKGAGWNLALNLGMDAVGLIPVVGDAVSAANAAKSIRKSLPTILKLISLAGMGDAAATAAKKIANGEKWTVRDLSLVANAVTSGIAITRMGGFGKSSKTNKVFQSQKVKVGDKEIEIDARTIQGIANKKAGEQAKALEDAIKAHPNAAGATAEQVTTAANNLLKNKKSAWQWVRRKDGNQVLDTTKVKGNETTNSNSKTALGRWWRGEGEDRAAYLARLRGEQPTKTVQEIVVPENTTPGLLNTNVPAVVTETKVPTSSPWLPMVPHILAPFHTRTDYTYPALPDYNPEIQVPNLTYEPYMAKKGGVIKAANGVPQLYNTDFLKTGTNFKINPITGKPESSTQFNTNDYQASLKSASKFNVTTPSWNPTYQKSAELPYSKSVTLPDYTTIGNTVSSNSSVKYTGDGDPGGQPLDAPITDGNNRLFNPDLPISAIRLAGILWGADKRWPKVTNAPQMGSVSWTNLPTYSTVHQHLINQLNQQVMNGLKPISSNLTAYYAAKLQQQAGLNDSISKIATEQSALEQDANAKNAAGQMEASNQNTQIAYQNAQARDAKEMAKNQFEAAKETEKQASIQQALYELQARISQDQQYRSAINTKEYADKLNAGFDKYLASLSQADWDKWNTLTPEQQYEYGDFKNYLAKVNPTIYSNNKLMIEKRQKDRDDAITLSRLRGRLNFPVTMSKKGGRVNGNTRYTLEPDERIWIDNNKAAHAKIAKLNDNAIKLLLRALK